MRPRWHERSPGEHFVEEVGVRDEFGTAPTVGTEAFVDRLDDHRLDGATRPSVVDGRGELCRVGTGAQGREEHQAGHLGAAVEVVGDRLVGVGLGGEDQWGGVVLAGSKLDASVL